MSRTKEIFAAQVLDGFRKWEQESAAGPTYEDTERGFSYLVKAGLVGVYYERPHEASNENIKPLPYGKIEVI